jgi:hypothetical protein
LVWPTIWAPTSTGASAAAIKVIASALFNADLLVFMKVSSHYSDPHRRTDRIVGNEWPLFEPKRSFILQRECPLSEKS